MTPEEIADLVHLRRARDLMDRNYAQPLDVAALARVALMSPGHFSRRFRAAYGETPYSYLMTRRIERAMVLLRRGEPRSRADQASAASVGGAAAGSRRETGDLSGRVMSVTEVCWAVGCSSLGTFSTRFTELVGMSPSAYRRQARSTAGIPPCVAKQVTRPIRNREASSASHS